MNKAELILVEMFALRGVTLSTNEVKDFQLEGNETNVQLDEMVRDYMSELQTENAEHRAFLKNPGSVDPINF